MLHLYARPTGDVKSNLSLLWCVLRAPVRNEQLILTLYKGRQMRRQQSTEHVTESSLSAARYQAESSTAHLREHHRFLYVSVLA